MSLKNGVLSICFVALGIMAYVPVAHAGWLDFLFPTVETGPDPSETLRAPFANEDAVIEDFDSQGNPQKQVPLELRHRPNTAITKWVQNTVPMMLSYKTATYEKEYAKKALTFSKVGAEEYVKFLQEKNILRTLKTGRYDVTGIIQDYPVIINEGPVDGRYRWLFQVNVLVTYFDAGTMEYPEEGKDNSITQEFTITMQVGRAKNVSNEHSVLIETWNAKSKKR